MIKIITARYKLRDLPNIITKANIRNEEKVLIKQDQK